MTASRSRRRPARPPLRRLGGAWGAPASLPLALAWVLASTLALASALPAAALDLAMAPLSDRQGDPEAAQAAEAALREILAADHVLVDPEVLRAVLRQGRIRVIDDALPEELRQVAAATGAQRILSFTLHQTDRRETPALALSGRAYDGATGELLWAGFEAASGLDGRTFLGLGVVADMAELSDRAARRLARGFLEAAAGGGPAPALDAVVLVPFGSVADSAGTNAAETVTEVTRAALHRAAVPMLPGSRVQQVLRQRRWAGWGGIDDATRRDLAEQVGARWVLTGSVETWDLGGSAEEPEPRIAVSLRLIDAETGRIAWLEGREAEGWDHQGPFRTGRTYTRGDLAEELVATMIRRCLKARAGQPQ